MANKISPKLAKDITRLDDLRLKAKRLEDRIKRVQEDVLDQMLAIDLTEVELETEGGLLRAIYVQPTRQVWDVDALKGSLSKGVFNSVTKVVVDAQAIEEAVKMGSVPFDVVASSSEIVENRPYVRISLVRG